MKSLALLILVGCGTVPEYGSCSVSDNLDGTYTLSCPDGSDVTIRDGTDLTTQEPRTLEGNFILTNSADMMLLNMFDTVEGYLRLGGDIQHVSLPNLVSVRDHIVVFSSNIQSVELDSLEFIGSYLTVLNNPEMQSLVMGELNSVGGDFEVSDNPLLPSCEVDTLYGQLQDHQDAVDIIGNNDAAACN